MFFLSIICFSVSKNKKKKNEREKKKVENVSDEEATKNVLKKQETSQLSSTSKAQNGTLNNAM